MSEGTARKRLAGIPKCFRPAYEAALRQGWTVEWTRGSHLAWRPPGGQAVFTAGTPGDVHGIRAALTDLRSAGLVLSQEAPRSVPRQRGSRPRTTRLRPERGVLLAEARSLIGVPAAAGSDTGLYERLTALRFTLTLLYSLDLCTGCGHRGWAHCGHCTRSCGCGMRVRNGSAA